MEFNDYQNILFISFLLFCHGNTFLLKNVITYITWLLGRVYQNIFPSVKGKPWSVMSPSAFGIGWRNTPGLSCHLGKNILVYHPRSHVIYCMYIVCSDNQTIKSMNYTHNPYYFFQGQSEVIQIRFIQHTYISNVIISPCLRMYNADVLIVKIICSFKQLKHF
jgi:hypothetical protein